jgi:Lrp/AsnC ligand binding domain
VDFDQAIVAIPQVIEVQRLLGEPDYLLRVVLRRTGTPSQPTFIHNVEIVIAHPFRSVCYYSSHHGRTRDKAPRTSNDKPKTRDGKY